MSIELENEYIELICTIYPDLAVTWGIPKCGYNDFTNWGIKQNINKLEQLLRKSKLQNANRNFRKSVELRIYELTSLYEYRYSAYYCYLIAIKPLLEVIESIDYYNVGMNEEVVISRVRGFSKVINKAINEIRIKKLSKLDLLYTKYLIKKDLDFLKSEILKECSIDSVQQIYYSIELFFNEIKTRACLKIAAAASIGCLLAVLFQLQTPTSAGIIAILSLQNTLVSNTVLVLHLYAAQSVHPALLVNELLLLLTGTSCGILMNLYMPGNSSKIRRAQSELEQIFRNTFHRIARDIVMDKQLACTFFDLSDLDLILKKLEKEAHENQGNTLLSDEQYFVKYVEMRKNQKLVVEKLCQNIRLLHDVPIQAHAISHFIEDVSIKFHESNNTQELMQKLTEMQTSMQKEPLPVTRTEFENRAVLYRILYDLEELITIKKRFIETLTPDEIKRFWNTSQNCCQ